MLKDSIEQKIRTAFCPTFFQLEDESSLHKGHPGAKGREESHFSLTLISSVFEGLSPIQRHQRVYACLSEEFGSGKLHALRMKTLCPGEALPEVE